MDQTLWAQVGTIALVTGLLVVSQWLTLRSGTSAKAAASVLQSIAEKLESRPLSGGGGIVGRYTVLEWLGTQALPAWSQQQSETSQGQPADARYNSCGETCVAMAVAACWGVPVAPDQIRADIQGPVSVGLTTGADLVAMLRYNNMGAQVYSDSPLDALARIGRCGEDGRSCIILGMWATPGGALHWLITTGVSSGRVSYVNPWGGVRSWITTAEFASLYRSSIVEITSHYHVDASHLAVPV